ncbi:hypothetical protein SUGI_0404740 [Cryptomeria japonica]|nr:hypothetical protein SUGI_0404740 [Cryptomeria japonica]
MGAANISASKLAALVGENPVVMAASKQVSKCCNKAVGRHAMVEAAGAIGLVLYSTFREKGEQDLLKTHFYRF